MFKQIAAPLIALSLFAMQPIIAHAWEWGSWGWGKTVSGSGTIKTETRSVAGFTAIKTALPGSLEIRQGATEGVTIEADDNIVPLIETVVEDGALKLRPIEKNMNFKTKKLNIIVNAKTVEVIAAAGSSEIRAGSLKSDKLTVSVAGSGDVRISSLDANTLKISVAGSGDFTAGGKVKTTEASIAGSGEVKLAKLETQSTKLSIAGSGNATVWANEALKVSVAGSGDVKYYGNAQVSKSVAGSGSITRLGDKP